MSSYQKYVDAIKKSATTTGKRALISAVAKKLPFLFIPVLGPLVELLLGKIVEILIEQTEFAVFFSYIDMRVDSQGKSFSEAAVRNFNAQINGSKEERELAEKELIEKFRSFAILGS